MAFVLNETTETVHKQAHGASSLDAVCGATYHLAQDHLTTVPDDRIDFDAEASKCGRCFDEGGGSY